MSSTQTSSKAAPTLVPNGQSTHGDWSDNFFKNGCYIFKGLVPKEEATEYCLELVAIAPERKGLSCVRDLLNLAPAGSKDGHLVLTIGFSALFEEYFEENGVRPRFNNELEWFKQRGCTEIKVEAEPGDLVLWDSRTIHHVARNESEQIRSVIYVCMTPRDLPSQEDLDLETNIFKKFEAATHWPHCNIWRQGKAQMNGERDPSERDEPLEKPVVTDQILRLAGIKPYHE
ncbi:hypothetical protein BJY01DRAFT_250730 [Aspergillus pseudoustus]|uniref:Phytanoyl-CoA dioxygenase n=1 Tax=Aspergillus pseudoustus TaxID=1810923 RepID=A0ABR4JIR6_9EURO